MAVSIPTKIQINHVATAREYSQKLTFINGNNRTGSFLTQATVLVYDDIIGFQNTTPKLDVIDTLTPRQKKAIYAAIKTIYEPMYGVSGSPYYDETYFNLLKGYVGSYFYKEYDWFNTNDTLNIFEFAALNLGNALYQFIDAVWTDETIKEAYNDYAEQGMGVYRAWQEQGNDSTYFVRDELKGKRIKVDLWDDAGTSLTGEVVYAGFDDNGALVVWDSASYATLGTEADISEFDYDSFAGNVKWFMDELVGMESDWDPKAEPAPTPTNPNPTAYGYVQFTEASIVTAVNRYAGHLKSFNDRTSGKGIRNIKYWSVPISGIIYTPLWLTKLTAAIDEQPNALPGPGYNHKQELDRLTYDQIVALAFVHLHSKNSKDSNFIILSTGDVPVAKTIYSNNHHTNPDAATLKRLNVTIQTGRDKNGNIIPGTDPGFFRIHYVPAPTIISIAKSMPIAQSAHLLYDATVKEIINSKYKDVVNKVKSWFGL